MRGGCLIGLGVTLLLGAGSACGDDDGATGEGDAAVAGASGGAAGDDGTLVWTPKDAGQDDLPPVEIPPPGTSGDDPTGQMCSMTRNPLPAALLPRCAASTRDCIDACPDAADPDGCRDACIAADTTPPEAMYGLECDSCIYLQLFACIDAAGCHDGVAEVFCCLSDKCPQGSPEGCGEQQCGAELMAALTCGYYAKMECLQLTQELAGQCFPPDDDADGGV